MTTRFLLEFCNVLSIEYLYGPFLLVIFSTLCIFCCDARSSFRIILQCNILRLCGGVAWILPTWSTECVPRWPWVIMIGDIFCELAVRFYLNCVIPNPTSCHQAHHDFFLVMLISVTHLLCILVSCGYLVMSHEFKIIIFK